MNKKGQELAFGLLPLVAIALCVIALLTFFSYNNEIKSNVEDTTLAIKQADFNEQYIYSIINLAMVEAKQKGITKETFKEAALNHDLHLNGQGNLFALVQEDKFNFDAGKDGYIVKFDELFVLGQTDTISIKRNMSAELLFNGKGEFVRFISK